MSALPGLGGKILDGHGVPPKEQRILAPSAVDVDDTGGYSRQCVCSLRITDPINLTVYYVPMTPQMVERVREDLTNHDPSIARENRKDDHNR